MLIEPQVGEVWYADLGMVEKSRPVLVLVTPLPSDARSLVIVAPLTSQIRSQRGEVYLGKPRWLPKESAINLQGIASFDPNKRHRRMGKLSPEQLAEVKAALSELFDL